MARLLSGLPDSEAALAHARELLTWAARPHESRTARSHSLGSTA